jgi:glycosyltransferase involved in cell wall biosynthesis
VGRLIRVKGGDVFLDALSHLPAPRPVAAVVGYGTDAAALQQQATALGLAGSVRFYDNVRDAGRLFRAFDTYVLSSRSEGLPIVMLEAMAAGTPIVATRVGGVPDLLSETEGWLVAPEDPPALARAIATSLRDRDDARARAAGATRRLTAEFAMEPWLIRYEEVYRSVQRPT